MQRLSQVSSHLAQQSGISDTPTKLTSTTPRQTDHGLSATPNITTKTPNITTNMVKTKVVVTRQLIYEAQKLLDARKEDLEIVQWQSEQVCMWRRHGD